MGRGICMTQSGPWPIPGRLGDGSLGFIILDSLLLEMFQIFHNGSICSGSLTSTVWPDHAVFIT